MQRRSIFSAGEKKAETNIIPATASFKLDKKNKKLHEQPPTEKMLCALRKVLTSMSDKDPDKRRYFIANNAVELTKHPTSTAAKEGELATYQAAGKCTLGVTLPTGEMSTKKVAFEITFRDIVDDRGLPDVMYIEPTTIQA